MNCIPSLSPRRCLSLLTTLGILALSPARAATTIEFGTNNVEVVEGQSLFIPLAVSPAPWAGEIRYRVWLTGGTATADDYYGLWSQERILYEDAANPPSFFAFDAADDGLPESDETLELRLEVIHGAEAGAQTNLAVVIHSRPASVNLHATWLRFPGESGLPGFYGGFEGGIIGFFVERSGDTNLPVTVDWATTGEGSAIPGVDFVLTNGMVTIPAGARFADTKIQVPATDNGVVNLSKTLSARLSNPSPGITIGDGASATAEIRDNEAPATQDFQAAAQMSGSLAFPVRFDPEPTAALPDGGLLRLNGFFDGSPPGGHVLFRYDSSGNLVGLTELPAEVTSVSSFLADEDRRVFVSGYFQSVQDRFKWRLVRLEADGRLDKTFTPLLDAFGNPPEALLRQPGGRLVVARWADDNSQVLLRLLSDGTIDPTFAATSPGWYPGQTARVWQHIEGSFLVQGTNRLLRFSQDGVLDAGFQAPEGSGCCRPVTVLPDGRVLVIVDGRMVRLKPDGGLDAEFHSFNAQNGPSSLLPDGRFLAGQQVKTGRATTLTFGMVMLPDGRPDPGLPEIPGFFGPVEWDAIGVRPTSTHVFANGKVLGWGSQWYRFIQAPKTAVALVEYLDGMLTGTWRPEVFVRGNGDEAAAWSFSVRRFGETTKSARVRVRTLGGTLQAGVDYEPLDQEITFAPLEVAHPLTLNFKAARPPSRSGTVLVEMLEAEGFEEVAPPVTVVLGGTEPAFAEQGVEFLPGGWTGLVLDDPTSHLAPQFEVSDNLQTWQSLRLAQIWGDYGRWVALDPNAADAPQRFYRARAVAP